MKRRNLKTVFMALLMGAAVTTASWHVYASELDMEEVVSNEEAEEVLETVVSETMESVELEAAESASVENTEASAAETAVPEQAAPAENAGYIVPEGVLVNGIDMSGMTIQQLEEQLQGYINNVYAGNLTMTSGEHATAIPHADLGVTVAEHTLVDAITSIGQKGNLVQRYKELKDVKVNTASYQLTFNYDHNKMKSLVTAAIQPFNQSVKDAALERTGGEFVIVNEVIGRKINVDATIQAVEAVLNENWNGSNQSVEAVAEETQPTHTRAELEVITDRLGGYSTYYTSGGARGANIYNGARLIDGRILYPGEEFSFLQAVMPFTGSNGYYESTGYLGGKIVPSMGGGICQVSSTLYNAVLRAELEIVERYNHGLTVGYVPLAADATVAEDSVDFKFKNNMETPVYIEADAYDGELYIAIYGKDIRPDNRYIEFYSETEEEFEPGEDIISYDSSLPDGYREVTQGAYTGYVASLYKYIYVDDELQETVHVNRSEYSSAPRYVTVGTGSDSTDSESDDTDSESSDDDE